MLNPSRARRHCSSSGNDSNHVPVSPLLVYASSGTGRTKSGTSSSPPVPLRKTIHIVCVYDLGLTLCVTVKWFFRKVYLQVE